MTADDAQRLWYFDANVSDGDVVRCPECKADTPLAAWREGEVYCEDCGDHAAMVCPSCDERFDHVHGPTFHVVKE